MRKGRKRREKGRGGTEEGRERGGWEGRERERKEREGGREGGKDGGGREIHMKIIANNLSKRDSTEARRKCSRTDLNFPKASLM